MQGFEADTWGLGLCLVHLLTGSCPYEETMQEVAAPPLFREAVEAVWRRRDRAPRKGTAGPSATPGAPTFRAMKRVLHVDEDGILATTLYRYAVLLEWFAGSTSRPAAWASNPAWKAMDALLGDALRDGPSSLRGAYLADVARCGLWAGAHPLCERARRRMRVLPGCAELLRSMLALDPAARPTMRSALLSPFFAALRERLPNDRVAESDTVVLVVDGFKTSARVNEFGEEEEDGADAEAVALLADV